MIDKVIEDELADLLRGSHDEHAAYIKKTFNVDLSKNFPDWIEYLELFERRNIAAHNDLLVDKQYIRNIKRQSGQEPGVSLGDKLDVSNKYVIRCIELCTEAGARLIFELWRAHSRGEENAVYTFMNELSFNLIKQKKYVLAVRILTHVLDNSSSKNPEKSRRMMAVNLANAHKMSGNKKEAEKAIKRFQWDSSSDQFQACVAAVRDDVGLVVKLMDRLADENSVGKSGFRTWPVFESMRREPEFASEFERLFGEPVMASDADGELGSAIAENDASISDDRASEATDASATGEPPRRPRRNRLVLKKRGETSATPHHD